MNKQRELLEKNKYIYVKEMVSADQCMFLREAIEEIVSKRQFGYDDQCTQSPAIGFKPGIESAFPFLQQKLNDMLQMELIPTYAYARHYSHNETMVIHTDRPECEYSFTMTVDHPRTKPPWEICFGDKDDPIRMSIERGDAVVYKGCEIPHWREANPNPWQIQIFYHFVDADGPLKERAYDGRRYYQFDQQLYEEFMRRGN
jgi:hypothetical protein